MEEKETGGAETQTTVQTTVQTEQTHKSKPVREPRIYVASLADYTAGRLYGWWVSAFQPAEDIRRDIDAMLARSEEPIAEEWAIHDYEGFEGLKLSEYENLEHVAEAARMLVDHGPVIAGLLNHLGGLEYLDDAGRYMDEGYRGAFDSLTDYVTEFVEDCYGDVLKSLPEFLRYHIDYEGIAHDMELSGDVFTIECGREVHVFDAHI